MLIIRKEFHFSASHVLANLPEGHPCTRLHGHNYIVTVELAVRRSKDLNAAGFVQDYRELDPIKKYIDSILDHKHLNDVFPGMQPSAELLALELYKIFKPDFPKLRAIEVCETPKTVARYEL